jgi:cytochrome c biogenesis protein
MYRPVVTVLLGVRTAWRTLTSMRTALILLFLLALAALPGALLPQHSLDESQVEKYYHEFPAVAPVLDRLGFFNVFGSVWFAAIYLLLFISLVGCLFPRCWEYLRQFRGKPVRVPRNLGRMPHYEKDTVDGSVDQVMSNARRRLRGWRLTEHTEADGARSVSAERGYLREAGNLIFHFALLAMLIGFAGSKLWGYSGQVIVMANGSSFCNSGTYNYDSFTPGLEVTGTNLAPFCVKVNDFDAKYLSSGESESFRANLQYQSGQDLATDTWKPYTLQVNHPLRTAGDRVYLTGNGYAPVFTVTFPNGQRRTGVTQWEPVNMNTYLSEGATKFDPPDETNESVRDKNEIAITGLFAPTATLNGSILSSTFPGMLNPAVAVDVMQGNLGLDNGRGQSIFTVNQAMVQSGQLKTVARQNMFPGDQIRLPDGTLIHFDGVQRWVNLQVSHDPFEIWMLVAAISLVVGLGVSLRIKRRRVWVRAVSADEPDPDQDSTPTARTVVEVGGLARTDQAGYGEEFAGLAADLLAADGRPQPTSTRIKVSVRGRKS